MKLACNWSMELEFLLNAGEVEIDYLKAAALEDYDALFSKMRKTHPILLHGFDMNLYAGTRNAEDIDFAKLNNLLDFCSSPHFGIHLSVNNEDVKPGMSDYDISEKMIANIEFFKKNIDLPVLVENVPDCNRDRIVFRHHPFSDAELISHVINTTDVGFLFDITHAKITCLYHGSDFYEYATRLPLEKVREIHVNGSGYDEAGNIADIHAAMVDEDYKHLQWVTERTEPQIITLEYGWQAKSQYGAEMDKLKEALVLLQRFKTGDA